MGFTESFLRLVLEEDSFKPIAGQMATLGRNSITVKPERLERLAQEFGKPSIKKLDIRDTSTKSAMRYGFYYDQNELLKLWFPKITKIDIIDVSSFEGANVIIDLQKPLPHHLASKYEVILDGSVIDNVFNPSLALANCDLLLKGSGRYLGINVSSFIPGAQIMLPPEWFYAYFSENNYIDVKVYVTHTIKDPKDVFEWKSSLFLYSPLFVIDPNFEAGREAIRGHGLLHSLVVAEKQLTSGGGPSKNFIEFSSPIGLQYLESTEGANRWDTREVNFASTSRPIMRSSAAEKQAFKTLYGSSNFLYLGEIGDE